MSASSVAARRYAKALYELASESKQVEKVRQDLTDLAKTFETNAELRQLVENPAFGPEAKKKAIVALAQRMGAAPVLISTLKLLVDRRRIGALGDISEAFTTIAERKSGRVRAEIITATPLPDAYYAQLEKTLSEVTGRQVTILKRTDPSIIGGVVARVGDTVFDGSIANRLKDIKQQLLEKAAPFAS
ncbi:MAG: ATP synthase F1 subunit delta [Deltaproteobacteria bacterium]|nr:ATP synthase F1 subunit delta [Deltaproteobacteria bacterium]